MAAHAHAIKVAAHLVYYNMYQVIKAKYASFVDKQSSYWKQEFEQTYNFIVQADSNQKKMSKVKNDFIITPSLHLTPMYLFGFLGWENIQPIDDYIPLHFFQMYESNLLGFFYSMCSANRKDILVKHRLHSFVENWNTTIANTKNQYVEELISKEAMAFEDAVESDRIAKETEKPQMLDEQQQDGVAVQEASTIVEANTESKELSFQRKITVYSNDDLENEVNPRQKMVERKRQSIIIFASFVDRLPNLAGLTRTCEIFAAEKLVMADTRVTKLDEFKSVSVSSHLWMPMEDCLNDHASVLDYLKLKKVEGYAIVGVEQTSSSVSLEKFSFPKKCVLVLGKEKEGVPAELIQWLDYCVEIPQLGVVRSLNVHVCASIMLFEYTRQQLVSK